MVNSKVTRKLFREERKRLLILDSGKDQNKNEQKQHKKMTPFFKELFVYNHHHNQKLWTVIHDHPDKTSEKSVELFNHILNAHHIWNNRIEPQQIAFGVWDIHPIQDCRNIDKANYEHTLLLLDKVDLHKKIMYTNTKGQTFDNLIQDILFHIINHSTYHRGQIATEFRQNGLDPVNTDYIFYKRQIKNQ